MILFFHKKISPALLQKSVNRNYISSCMCTTSCADINECAGARCQGGSCLNTKGSYVCVCDSGYALDPVKESCVGMYIV